MATFPALIPSGRTFTPGEYPNTSFTAWSGSEGRVRHSNVMLGSALRLTFKAINETQMLSILSHYQGQRGGFESFILPNDVWSGVATTSEFNLTAYRWCYTESPTVIDLPCGNHDVELSLATVPPEGVSLNGLEGLVTLLLSGGNAVVSNGLSQAITWSLVPGRGDAPTNVDGLTSTIAISISGGNPQVIPSGISASIATSLMGGGALASNGLNLGVQTSIAGGTPSVVFIDYPNFASTSGLSLVSTDGVASNFLYLTNTTSNNVGNAWTTITRAYNGDFSVEWQFECSGGTGADGFTIQWHTTNSVNGGSGGDKGRVLSSSVPHAISFGTFANPDNVAWYKNNSLQGTAQNTTLSGGWRQNVYYWLDYNHGLSQAKLYYSTTNTKPASPSHTFNSFAFGSTAYYMGFGAATGGYTDNHILKAWKAY